MKILIESQFGYCLLIWMFHSRRVNNEINNLHESALRIGYKDNYSSYMHGLACKGQIAYHPSKKDSFPCFRNYVNLNLSFDCDNVSYFKSKSTDLQFTITDFVRDCVDTWRYDLSSLSYSAPQVWVMKKTKNINSF